MKEREWPPSETAPRPFNLIRLKFHGEDDEFNGTQN